MPGKDDAVTLPVCVRVISDQQMSRLSARLMESQKEKAACATEEAEDEEGTELPVTKNVDEFGQEEDEDDQEEGNEENEGVEKTKPKYRLLARENARPSPPSSKAPRLGFSCD